MSNMIVLQALDQGWHYTSVFGMIVGWLVLTYGVVIWGSTAYSHIPSRYGFMFAAFGLGLMLLNNRVIVNEAVAIMFLRFVGNLTIALVSTVAVMWLRHRQLDLPDATDPDLTGD